jgi:hypothetical protein
MVDIVGYLRKNYYIIAVIGGVLAILNYTGFVIDIPSFYYSLSTEGKIAFVGVLNFIITVLAFVFILNRIGNSKEKERSPPTATSSPTSSARPHDETS